MQEKVIITDSCKIELEPKKEKKEPDPLRVKKEKVKYKE